MRRTGRPPSNNKAVAAAVDPDGAGIYDITYRTITPEDGTERWVSRAESARRADFG
jgi:hypothetical protein